MKLIGFSPWQHVATSVPQSSNINDIVYKTVGKASAASSSKRLRASHDPGKKNNAAFNEQPDLVLTTDHQISIISHTSSKKILRGSGGDDKAIQRMKELPHWIYTSRPGDQSSFLPKSSDSRSLRVGAVVDAHSRSVFTLQKDNTVLKIWSLDDEVTGPEEAESAKLVDKVDFPSAVVCMETIPYSRQSRVRIKEQNRNTTKDGDSVQGGVVGLLTDGQLFVILVSCSRQLKIGFFGNKESISTNTRSRRRSTSTSQKSNMAQNHVFATVGYSAGGVPDGTAIEVAGQKRKAITMVATLDDSLGDVTLTTLSLDPKNMNAIVFCKHTVKLSSLDAANNSSTVLGDNSKYQGIHGSYQKEEGKLGLPNEIHMPTSNGNGSSHNMKPVHITQLDQTHVGCVYQSSGSHYFATILDIRYGECIVHPFKLALNSSKASVMDIGGLSTSILAVTTSEDYLLIYDVRRAIILYQSSIDELLGLEEKQKYSYKIASDWISGTIGIIRKNRDFKNGSIEKAHVSFSKIGIFDSSMNREESAIISKPLLKGSYNLARAIASSMATTASMEDGTLDPDLSPLEQNMMSWLASTPRKSDDVEIDAMENLMKRLVKIRKGQKNGSKDTLCKILSDYIKLFSKVIPPSSKSDAGLLPQRAVDIIVRNSIEVALAAEPKSSERKDAIAAFMTCIKSGKFDGRIHFDKALSIKTNDVLRSLLFLLKRMRDSDASTNLQIENSPLYLIFCLVKYCDSLSEHMLVSLVHFVLCHVSDEELASHWNAMSNNDEWYADTRTESLEKLLKEANTKLEVCDESKENIENLERRLAISQKMFFVERIITHSTCNTALLREALREGITHADKGEVEVLMHLLSRLLRKAGRHCTSLQKDEKILNVSSCISQWLSALIDAYLGMLLTSHSGQGEFKKHIDATRKEVSALVAQTQALVDLNELLDHTQAILESRNHESKPAKNLDVSPLPLYGIEPLIF